MRKLLNIFAVLTLLLLELAVVIPIQLTVSNSPVLAATGYANYGGVTSVVGGNTVHTYNVSGTTYFYACATGTVQIECWGAGGGGGIGSSDGGGGGGGGAYAKNASVPVTAGTTYVVVIGWGGSIETTTSGGNSSFGSNVVLAVGGSSTSSSTGATGGQATSCVGDTKYNGGSGGNSNTTGDSGGGGGGAGGKDGAGVAGQGGSATLGGNGGAGDNGSGGAGGTNVSANNGNPGTSNVLGGGGGAGGDDTFNGGIGGIPGGGGGGGECTASIATAVQSGGNGQVVITCVTANFQGLQYTSEKLTSSSGVWTVPSNVSSIDVLVVGGGGPTNYAGGGGGGVVYYDNIVVWPGQQFYYTVGAGGSVAVNGGNSTFCSMTAVGGGVGSGGGGGSAGGCGGGGLTTGGATTQPTSSGGGVGVGYKGGDGWSGVVFGGGGGGGGNGSVAHSGTGNCDGDGGNAYLSPIFSDNSSPYAAGGGGSIVGTVSGRNGGGWTGSANTGCGGNLSSGSTGYSGVVVVGYAVGVCTNPSPPNSINLIPWSNSFEVTWNKGSGAYYTRFVRKAGSLPANFSDGTLAYLGTGTRFYDTALTPGITYYYLAQSESFIGGWPGPGYTQCNSSTNASSSAQCLAMPAVVTNAITNVGVQSAVLNGEITSLGGTTVTSWGFYWDTTPNMSSESATGGSSHGVGDFDLTFNSTDGGVTPLVGGTTYYIRAFAACSNGTSWGEETSFTALDPAEGDTLLTFHDSCGASRTHIPVQADLSVSSFISGGFLDSTGLNQEMSESSSARYSMLNTSTGWVRTIIPSLVTYGTKDYTWTTGYAPSDTLEDSIIGTDGLVSCSANTSQLPGATYDITWQGYLNSSAAGPILEVVNSFGIGSFGNGSIWGYVLNSSSTNQSYASCPTSDLTTSGNITAVGAPYHYDAINDSTSPTGNDSDTTYVTQNVSAVWSNDSYGVDFSALGCLTGLSSTLSAKQVATSYAKVGLIIGGTTNWSAQYTLTSAYVNYDTSFSNVNWPVGSFYGFSNFSCRVSSASLSMKTDSPGWAVLVTQWFLTYYYKSPLYASAAVASGSHTISLVGNSSYCGLYVDGVLANSFNPGGLPTYSGLGVVMDTDVCLATRQAIITTSNSSTILDWGLRSILTGSTLYDYSGMGNNGSVTWGTVANCLSVTLGGAQSGEDYSAPETGGGSGTPEEVIPGLVPTANDSAWWRGTTDVSDARFSSLPMYGLFKRAADAGWGSVYVLYMFAMIATSVVLGLITYMATGSYLVACVGVGVCLFAASTTGVISGWIVVIYGAACGCYITVARSL